ncbi:SCL-interrupting locus protein homolog isoform X2 [Brachyhypopomus gauderio]|uniref:SCL-interrupting locus protein homolog isoform X2 n=1 Tax=Brachyhypopomus gauderio TaxID=698409 RepID=UPI0040424647
MNRVQVNLRGLSSHVFGAVCRPDTVQTTRLPENVISTLTFPQSKMHLWDHTAIGDVVTLHLSFYRNPRLLLLEKALRLAHRHARQSNQPHFSCFFIGTLAVDSDEEGVTLTLDRFDPGREQPGLSGRVPTALLPGDVLVPCLFEGQHATDVTVYSAADYETSFKLLQHCCSSRETLDLSKLLSLRVRLSCSEVMDRLSFGLRWAALTPAGRLQAVPVRAVPIIPTALARNLSSPASIGQPLHSTGGRRGFLTMDQTRKLLLMLESDPKAYTLPLVGVWLSGVTHIHNPVVWAWCLRYLHGSSFQDRVLSDGNTFLVVLYSLTHRDPEFFQCKLHSDSKDGFQLLVSTESLALYKNVEPLEGKSLLFELGADGQSREAELFKEVLSRSALSSDGGGGAAEPSATGQNRLSISDHDSGVEDEDLSPRPSPNPHPVSQQLRQVEPSVPELSMVLDGSFLVGKVDSHDPAFPHPTQSSAQRRSSSHHSRTGTNPTSQSGTMETPTIRKPLTPVLSQPRASRSKPAALHPTPKPSLSRKSIPSMGQKLSSGLSSSPSSSSSSSPKAGSLNGSFHQRTQIPGQGFASTAHAHQTSPSGPPASSHSCSRIATVVADQTPLPQPPQHRLFHSTPASTSCTCCPAHHGHAPVYQSNTWQGTPVHPAPVHVASSNPVHCPAEGSPRGDCRLSPTHQAQSCRGSPARTPVCHAGVPSHFSPVRASHGPAAGPSGGPLELAASPCQAQCCHIQSGCTGQPGSVAPLEGAMALLPADAYRMLKDQDRQLKLLQAQIQKLLDAQSKVSEPSQTSTEVHRGQQEQAIQTPVLSEPQKKTSVSVAVGTGASLFWSCPGHGPPDDDQPPQNPPEALWQTSDHSTASSGLNSEEEANHSGGDPSAVTALHSTSTSSNTEVPSFQSPVLGESASSYYNSQSLDMELSSGETEVHDQRFYQELLGQVKNRLQDSVTEESRMEQDPSVRRSTSPQHKPRPKGRSPEKRAAVSEQDQVFSATLKQLHNLGVTVDLHSSSSGVSRSTVESTSTLACINPEAVIPRLSLSEPVGTSLWGLSGGADLSLEANAIALKYLSDSQLSRLSLGGRWPGARSNPGATLFGRTPLDKSSAGLSLVSPSNMSLATCMYMRRYGLMEGGASSEEEEDDDDGGEETRAQRAHTDSAIGCSLPLDTSENGGQKRENGTGFILKPLTNKRPETNPLLRASPQNSQSQLIRDLRPKMQLLSQGAASGDKENCVKRVLPLQRSSLSENQSPPALPDTQGSVGNFLDLSRLRQLPKLF